MKIEHIAMYVADLKEAKAFFEKYFCAKSNELYHNKNTDFSSYFLTFDDGSRLELMHKPDILNDNRKYAKIGYAHIAFSAGSKNAVDELTERFKTDGYHVISGPRVTGDGYYESCIEGIEGNLIEITE